MNLHQYVMSEPHFLALLSDFLSNGDKGQRNALVSVHAENIQIAYDSEGAETTSRFMRLISKMIFSTKPKNSYVTKANKFGFYIFVPYVEEETVITDYLEHLAREVESTAFMSEDRMYPVSLSIGCLFFEAEGVRLVESLTTSAEACCDLASKQGRGQVVAKHFEEEFFTSYRRHVAIAPEITKALEFDRFTLFLQEIKRVRPKREGDVSRKFEVLVRMLDYAGGVVPPGEFIPVAERYGIIKKIDEWVLSKTFEQYEKLFPHHDGELSVNVSGYSIVSRDFLDFVERCFDIYAVPANRICFEITETFVISDFKVIEEFVERFGPRGVKFVLDDFGAGYASFYYLHNAHFDYIKIDGGYVRSILTNPKSEAIVRSVNSLCHDLDIETVAEFVENDEILSKVSAIGVDYVQGYAIGYPRPLELFLPEEGA